MKHKFTRNLYLLCFLLLLTTGFSATANATDYLDPQALPPTENNLTTEWQEYTFKNGILIEYKMQKVKSEDYGRAVNVLLLRFTNTTEQRVECSWRVKIERNGECANCSDLNNQDGDYGLYLNPNEVAEGNASNLVSRSELNVFGNFVKLVPGMTEQKLTGFEIINLTIK
ncbi:MAG: hypothetical protein AB8B56_18875 [Crocinitomicaceae bacterium]